MDEIKVVFMRYSDYMFCIESLNHFMPLVFLYPLKMSENLFQGVTYNFKHLYTKKKIKGFV